MKAADSPCALVVDDDPIIRTDICGMLEDAGFRCHEAETGDEAKQLLERIANEVTLLFSDVEMPGQTNGFALARHAAIHWPWIEIVVASGRVTPAADDLPERASFIAKPFSTEAVHEHLRKRLPDGKQPKPLKSPA